MEGEIRELEAKIQRQFVQRGHPVPAVLAACLKRWKRSLK